MFAIYARQSVYREDSSSEPLSVRSGRQSGRSTASRIRRTSARLKPNSGRLRRTSKTSSTRSMLRRARPFSGVTRAGKRSMRARLSLSTRLSHLSAALLCLRARLLR